MDKKYGNIAERFKRGFLLILTLTFILSSVMLTGCGERPVAAVYNSSLLLLALNNTGFENGTTPKGSSSNSGIADDTDTPSDTPADTPSDTSGEALLSLDEINAAFTQYGKMTIAGMKPEDYDAVQSIEWTTLNTEGKPESLTINLSKLMKYSSYEKYILNLDKYDGVEVSVIGKSSQDRNMYMVKVALGGEENKPVIMLSGSVHAREFAGAEYITKILNDTIKKAQTSSSTKKLLEKVVIVAVPLVNPDGREIIISGGNKNRKSNSNDVDLNRGMPSVNAGQLGNGVKMIKNFSDKPGLDFFAGYNLGTESETKAMIKWYDYYVPKATAYIDFHQQGGSMRYNKRFITSGSDALSKAFGKKLNTLLKKGYKLVSESKTYGLNGDGGTLTDYARSVAEGFKYSYKYGRMVLDENGTETPLIVFKDLDSVKEYYKPVNAKFRVATFEIGRTPSYLGAGSRARVLRKREYSKYGWSGFLPGLIKTVVALK